MTARPHTGRGCGCWRIAAGCETMKPMARRCVFCGRAETTKEHVWPNWAAKRMSDDGAVDHYLNVVQGTESSAERSWPMKQFTLTVGAVCGTCNNGWMGRLERRVKPFFEASFDGKGSPLDAGAQRDLAAWALKTAMMIVALEKPDEPAIPAEDYSHLYAHTEPPSDVRIWLGAYSGEISTAFAHTYAGDISAGDATGDIWGATIIFGPVIFQLLGSTIAGLAASAELNDPGVRQLWPYNADFRWEPSPGIDDAALPGFIDAFLAGSLGDDAVRRARQFPQA